MGDSLEGQSQIEILAGDREELAKMNKSKLLHSDSLRNEITADCVVNG